MRRVTDRTPARRRRFLEQQQGLLEVASNATTNELAAIMRSWAHAVDAENTPDEPPPPEPGHTRRRLFLSPVGDGWDLRGWLPGVEGAALAGALNAIMETQRRLRCTCVGNPGGPGLTEDSRVPASRYIDPADRESFCTCPTDDSAAAEHRTRPQARADALVDLLAGATGPDGALLSPGADSHSRTVLLIRAEDLNQEPDNADGSSWRPTRGWAHLRPLDLNSTWQTGNGPGSGSLGRPTMLAQLCDTTLQRLVIGAHSQPLDIGRATRVIPPALRTALLARDQGCVFPSCTMPHAWTHAHHIRHWSRGGPTSLRNLVSLCQRHHTLIHQYPEDWIVAMGADGHPRIRRGLGAPPG